MNYKKNAWQILGFTALSSLALSIFPNTASANPSLPLQAQDGYQVAQLTGCREVDVNTSLNVRQQPGGPVIGTLEDEQNVYISGEPVNGWVRINSPIDGYVFARYLNYCPGAAVTPSQPIAPTTPLALGGERVSTVPGSNCREVVSSNLPVRTRPGGEVIGTLQENQLVYIANEGVNGWVPIERPVSGYVSSANLGYCN
ncbi:MAG: SH3 domain-containing protein [Coleofasciculus sp. S288]|nr:SH3 domain-containing protein [Coleofasciculus sp. S288]